MKARGVAIGLAAIVCVVATLRADPPRTAPTKVYELSVDDEIEPGVAAYVERVVDGLKPDEGVVLRMSTFGGRIDSAVRMRDALLRCKGQTMTFVDGRAISAGALITLATDRIYMQGGATIGAATPITLQGGEMKPVEAKVVSYFRKEMKSTAEAKGRRGDLAEAMVDPAVEVKDVDGKETTLTLTTPEAMKLHFIDGRAESLDEALRAAGWPTVVTHANESWAERVASTLSDARVSSLLMTLGMVGVLIELWAPGHLLAGLFGACCLLLFFFGHYVVHLAGLGELCLFAGGVAAVVLEVTLFPGHGAIGVAGVLAVIASLVLAIIGRGSLPFDVSWALGTITRALVMVSTAVLTSAAALFVIARKLPSTRFGRALVLDSAIASTSQAKPNLVGRTGTAVTALRPAGAAEIDGTRTDVVSDGGFIDAGASIRVVTIDGPRIVVTKI